jgi:hypothetical protein
MKPAKPLPLGDFSELVFEGQFFFLNEQYQERATDACFNAHFYVCAPSAETPPDHYRLVARRPCDEQCVSVSALTGEYHLEFVCCATLSGARQTLCYTTGVIRATDIGSARTKTVREGGVSLLQAEVEVMGEMEAGEATYPLRLSLARLRRDCYVRQAELWLPRAVCRAWFHRAALAQRQGEAGITESATRP